MAANSTSGKPGVSGAYAMAGVQVLSTILQAEAVKAQAKQQADIDEFNAQLAEYDAWKAQAFGQTQIAKYQNQVDQAGGSAKVAAAAKGADIKSGSISEIVAENQLTGFMNTIELNNRAAEQAMGYKRQASSMRLGSDMRQLAANTQANSAILGGIAQGAGTVASGYIASQKLETNVPQKIDPSGYDTIPKNTNYDLSTNPNAQGLTLNYEDIAEPTSVRTYNKLGFTMMPY